MIIIGGCYANKNGKRAKSNVERIMKKKEEEMFNLRHKFLEENVFSGLKNLNSGFDSESIKYFSADDFKIVLQRIENLKLGIKGIEPWLNGEFYDVAVYEEFGGNPFDSSWYYKAFENFKKENKNLVYSATYEVPNSLLKKYCW